MTPAPITANQLTAQLLIEIPKRFNFTRLWRSNVIRAKTSTGRWVAAGLKGSADITGICGEASGCRTELEIKVGKDRLSPEQTAFRDMILKAGGIHIVARDLEQAMRDLQSAIERKNVRWER